MYIYLQAQRAAADGGAGRQADAARTGHTAVAGQLPQRPDANDERTDALAPAAAVARPDAHRAQDDAEWAAAAHVALAEARGGDERAA